MFSCGCWFKKKIVLLLVCLFEFTNLDLMIIDQTPELMEPYAVKIRIIKLSGYTLAR